MDGLSPSPELIEEWAKLHRKKIVDHTLEEIEDILNEQNDTIEKYDNTWQWFFLAGFICGIIFILVILFITKNINFEVVV